ncbi:hypothetical protein ACVDFE_00185 [Lentzea chajnantorensis]
MSFLEPANGPRNPVVGGPDLRRTAQQERQQEVQRAGLSEQFDWATVYVATEPDTDHIVIHNAGGGNWVHAYSEYGFLPDARFGHDEVWHRQLKGADLRRQLPEHVGIELDHGLPHARMIARPKVRPIALEEAE